MSDLSVTEYAVLGVLAERPSHGFAIARELSAKGDVGRIITVRRPLVYRALDRLVHSDLAEPVHTEKGDAGPNRVVHRATGAGRHELSGWLSRPVDHVRDMRIELLLKIALLIRSQVSPASLIAAQRRLIQPTLRALDEAVSNDPVEIWRQHSARAAGTFLEELAGHYG